MMVGQVPIAKFEPSELQGVLTNRLLHHCLDVILANLKECSVNAQTMLDPAGRLRNVRTFLAAYIADLPEQQALACVASNYAPSSVAGPTSLGDSACYNFLFSFLYYVTHADSPPLFPLFLTLCHHCDSILVTLHQGLAHDAK